MLQLQYIKKCTKPKYLSEKTVKVGVGLYKNFRNIAFISQKLIMEKNLQLALYTHYLLSGLQLKHAVYIL